MRVQGKVVGLIARDRKALRMDRSCPTVHTYKMFAQSEIVKDIGIPPLNGSEEFNSPIVLTNFETALLTYLGQSPIAPPVCKLLRDASLRQNEEA